MAKQMKQLGGKFTRLFSHLVGIGMASFIQWDIGGPGRRLTKKEYSADFSSLQFTAEENFHILVSAESTHDF